MTQPFVMCLVRSTGVGIAGVKSTGIGCRSREARLWRTSLIVSEIILIGTSEAKPLFSGWCETGGHGTSKPDGTSVHQNRMVRRSWGGPTTCT